MERILSAIKNKEGPFKFDFSVMLRSRIMSIHYKFDVSSRTTFIEGFVNYYVLHASDFLNKTKKKEEFTAS